LTLERYNLGAAVSISFLANLINLASVYWQRHYYGDDLFSEYSLWQIYFGAFSSVSNLQFEGVFSRKGVNFTPEDLVSSLMFISPLTSILSAVILSIYFQSGIGVFILTACCMMISGHTSLFSAYVIKTDNIFRVQLSRLIQIISFFTLTYYFNHSIEMILISLLMSHFAAFVYLFRPIRKSVFILEKRNVVRCFEIIKVNVDFILFVSPSTFFNNYFSSLPLLISEGVFGYQNASYILVWRYVSAFLRFLQSNLMLKVVQLFSHSSIGKILQLYNITEKFAFFLLISIVSFFLYGYNEKMDIDYLLLLSFGFLFLLFYNWGLIFGNIFNYLRIQQKEFILLCFCFLFAVIAVELSSVFFSILVFMMLLFKVFWIKYLISREHYN